MSNIQVQDRINYVGASEVAAVVGLNKWKSRLAVWMEKAGKVPREDIMGKIPIRVGMALESHIASWWANDHNCEITRYDRYLVHPKMPRYGASLDYIMGEEDKPDSVVEIKTVSEKSFGYWPPGAPPTNYIIQVQAQMDIADVGEGFLVVLVGNRSIETYRLVRRPTLGGLLRDKVEEFWKSVDDDTPPPPDFKADADVISHLAPADNKIIKGDEDYDKMIVEHNRLRAKRRDIDGQIKTLSGKIRHRMVEDGAIRVNADHGGAGLYYNEGFDVPARTQKAFWKLVVKGVPRR